MQLISYRAFPQCFIILSVKTYVRFSLLFWNDGVEYFSKCQHSITHSNGTRVIRSFSSASSVFLTSGRNDNRLILNT